MGKDTRTTHRAPRIGTRLVKDEDEISALLTPEQGQRLIQSGALSGDWEFTGEGTPEEAKAPDVASLQEELQRQEQAFNASWAALTQERDDLRTTNESLTGQLKDAIERAEKAEKKLKAKEPAA
jgi:hypothetical protein